jgi:DNA polymerase III gamma/tau subunit
MAGPRSRKLVRASVERILTISTKASTWIRIYLLGLIPNASLNIVLETTTESSTATTAATTPFASEPQPQQPSPAPESEDETNRESDVSEDDASNDAEEDLVAQVKPPSFVHILERPKLLTLFC